MANWRYNPRTGTYNAVSITDEIHTIGFDTEANAYGIRLDEAPQRSSPSTVTITETASGGSTFTEISSRTAPSAGQFWVDYDADTFTGTGFIEFNASDSGTEVSVDYQGLGSVVKEDALPSLTANNTWTGNNTYTGNNDYRGSLNVPSGESITHNSTPVAGYQQTGDAMFLKVLTGTTSAGTTSLNHFISGNPVTNAKIIDFSVLLLNPTGPQLHKQDLENTGGSPYAVIEKYITNTEVYFTQSDTSASGVTYYVTILYKV